MPRARLSDEDIERFRSRMCEIATTQFAEHGFQRVTMRALAAEMGCSPMTPYRYFENKEAILAAARNMAFLRLGAALRKGSESESDPLECISALARSYVAFALREPSCYRVMFVLDQREFSDFPVADPAGARAWQIIQNAFQLAVEARVIDGDPLTLAHAFWVVVHGGVSLHLAGKLVFGRGVQELTEEIVGALMRGFQPGVVSTSADGLAAS